LTEKFSGWFFVEQSWPERKPMFQGYIQKNCLAADHFTLPIGSGSPGQQKERYQKLWISCAGFSLAAPAEQPVAR